MQIDQERIWTRYEDFKNVLNHCGLFLLEASDDDIDYHIFEEFDDLAPVFFQDDLQRLFIVNGLIDEEISEKCRILRDRYEAILPEHPELWNRQAIRDHEEWRIILALADEIKGLLFI